MGFTKIFFDQEPMFKGREIIKMLVSGDGLPGLLLAFSVGIAAYFIGKTSPAIDALVVAVISGLILRLWIGKNDKLLAALLPGILIAPIILIPIGIILYGKNLNFIELTKVSPAIMVQLVVIVCLTFFLIWVLGRIFKLSEKMRLLLGAGSAVCGASAIAITSPVIKTDPDDLSKALIVNIAIGALGTAMLWLLFLPYLSHTAYATMAGTLLHQTGFVKIAASPLGNDILAYALAVKSIRVALLVIALPILAYIARKKLYIPWYLLMFIGVGALFSFVPSASIIAPSVKSLYIVLFTSALASIGLNTDVKAVIKDLPKPFAVITIAFLIALGAFMLGTYVIAY